MLYVRVCMCMAFCTYSLFNNTDAFPPQKKKGGNKKKPGDQLAPSSCPRSVLRCWFLPWTEIFERAVIKEFTEGSHGELGFYLMLNALAKHYQNLKTEDFTKKG